MLELLNLTHHFIVKIHTYHQGNMFRLQVANHQASNIGLDPYLVFVCTIVIPIVYITGVLLYAVFCNVNNWDPNRTPKFS